MGLASCCISVRSGRHHLLFVTEGTALHVAMPLQSPHVISKSVSIIPNKNISFSKALCLGPLQCIPTQQLSYHVRPKVIPAQNPAACHSPGENKSTGKACLPQEIFPPSRSLQHKHFPEVTHEALASKSPVQGVPHFNCTDSTDCI